MWHDYNLERPSFNELCLVEFENNDVDITGRSYKVMNYWGKPNGAVWRYNKGYYNDGKLTTRWMPITDLLNRNSFNPDEVDKKIDNWRQRLHDEYWELVTRIEKLEMALIKSSLDSDTKELLLDQRKAMLAYKDALFRRCFHHNIDLYRDTFEQTSEGLDHEN